jgi:hypothetical protein
MTDDYSVTVRREIAAPAEDLFDAWLNRESIVAQAGRHSGDWC